MVFARKQNIIILFITRANIHDKKHSTYRHLVQEKRLPYPIFENRGLRQIFFGHRLALLLVLNIFVFSLQASQATLLERALPSGIRDGNSFCPSDHWHDRFHSCPKHPLYKVCD